MSYDSKCYDLAEAFLSDGQDPVNKDDVHKLAQDIQDVIEDYLSDVEALKLAMERDLKGAVAMGKVWGEVFENLFSPKRS